MYVQCPIWYLLAHKPEKERWSYGATSITYVEKGRNLKSFKKWEKELGHVILCRSSVFQLVPEICLFTNSKNQFVPEKFWVFNLYDYCTRPVMIIANGYVGIKQTEAYLYLIWLLPTAALRVQVGAAKSY
jgi:hypothetical protein